MTAALFDPFVAGFAEDPDPHYARLRETAPAHRHDLGFWIVTDHRTVSELQRSGHSVDEQYLVHKPVWKAVTARSAELTRGFEDRFGRAPSVLERTRIAQQATLATRAAKAHDAETTTERVDRLEREARAEVADGLSGVAFAVLELAQNPGAAATWSPQDVMSRALAGIAEKQQTWTRSDLLRAVSDALPGQLGIAPGQVQVLLEALTTEALQGAIAVSPTRDLADQP